APPTTDTVEPASSGTSSSCRVAGGRPRVETSAPHNARAQVANLEPGPSGRGNRTVDVHREPQPAALDSQPEREVVPVGRGGNRGLDRIPRHPPPKFVELDGDRAWAGSSQPDADHVLGLRPRMQDECLNEGPVAPAPSWGRI